MLLRGQNLLGYRHYADDTVEAFVKRSVSEGIDIIRIFDALNDLRNVETAVKAARKEGAEVQLAAAYTTGDGYDIEYWMNLISDMESIGADSICIKDMAGILEPAAANQIIKSLKSRIKIPVHLHSHCTGGMAPVTYIQGIEAGCDAVDTAISPFAMGTSQPATEVIAQIYKGTAKDPMLNTDMLMEVSNYFRKIMDKLKEQKAMDRFYEVMEEIPRVRGDLGQPPLVTPSSQIVGTQAVLNVLSGERYKLMSGETKAFLHGDYGKTIKPFNIEVQRNAIGDENPVDVRPADLIEPELEKLRRELGNYMTCTEDILTYAMFPQVASEFFERREAARKGIDTTLYDYKNKAYPV